MHIWPDAPEGNRSRGRPTPSSRLPRGIVLPCPPGANRRGATAVGPAVSGLPSIHPSCILLSYLVDAIGRNLSNQRLRDWFAIRKLDRVLARFVPDQFLREGLNSRACWHEIEM